MSLCKLEELSDSSNGKAEEFKQKRHRGESLQKKHTAIEKSGSRKNICKDDGNMKLFLKSYDYPL